ncbi:Leucine-rich repeat-containing protein 1 (LANO adapter protein) (LAP and no PDZ protein) [Durusdinium trenchii]|uniref:Leucine-rich repeat-containing protein 1 (LANO adapter protein) (LAP and no PDZ protein) n=1 Tax=Durusdinium trenchii TaxID=1381693 RepID=A0ABP0RB49_9DINO
MTLDQSAADTSLETVKEPSAAAQGLAGPPASLKLLRGDIEAFVVTQRHNRDHEVDVQQFIENVYKPPDRYVMEALADAIALVENSNGGKLKPSKMFKRADLHALFSLLDKNDQGAVDIGEFTRNYQVHQGSLLDSMMRPIKSVKHEGGIEYGGPVQEKIDTQMRELEERHHSQALRSSSAPPNSGDDVASEAASRLKTHNEGTLARSNAGSNRSQISRTGASIASSGAPIYEPQVNQLTGKARISDVIRARFNADVGEYLFSLHSRGCSSQEVRCENGKPTELHLDVQVLRQRDPHLRDDVVISSLASWTRHRLKRLQINGLKGAEDGAVPSEICNLVHLESLQLNGNGFKSVAPCITRMVNLKELYLGNNRLRSLPKQLGKMHLKKLALGSNRFKTFPSNPVRQLPAEELMLQHNHLSEIPAGIQRLKRLRRLNLVANQLESVPEEIGKLKSLQAMMLDDNQLEYVPSSLKPIWLKGGLHVDGNPMNQQSEQSELCASCGAPCGSSRPRKGISECQAEDTMRKHATREFKVERIRARQRDFEERCWAANEAAQQYDEMKVARKAMNLLNYERRCHMSCA